MTIGSLVLGILSVVLTAAAVAHIVLTKRDVRAAIGWTGLALAFPLAGSLLYFVFGVNRVRRRARGDGERELASPARAREELARVRGPSERAPAMPPSRLAPLAFLVGRVVDRPLIGGNRVEPLVDGEEAYPRMLAAIGEASTSIGLSTYIFDVDEAGSEFIEALTAARGRGVDVRVLVDSVGARYSPVPAVRRLRRGGVRAVSFNPGFLPIRWPYLNLRTHRKILTIDGQRAFVGGMNLRLGHLVERARDPIHDIHFAVEGPVVRDIQDVFVGDWAFTTRERLEGPDWFPTLKAAGSTIARVIPDGPDEDLDKIRWTLLGALANAKDSVRIQTPYFLPDADLITAVQLAALRGVEIEILLPEVNNLHFVQWAAVAQLWQVLEHGGRVDLAPEPFDHSKLLLVDGRWGLVGSANWDQRSLRLNFEIDLELYDHELIRVLEARFERRQAAGRRLTVEELDARPIWQKLRDGVARLALPYL